MSASRPTVAAVLVTHNSARWIEQTLQSIRNQRHQPDAVIVIDDNSTDDTRRIINETIPSAQVYRATSRVDDTTTRIAQNFQQGLRAASDFDIAVLGDHDDVWHPGRIGHQVNQLKFHENITMLASNGALINAKGEPDGRTLRDVFPVPEDFNDKAPVDKLKTAIKFSIATGGASAVRPGAFAGIPIPPGWLHDRWWSLIATATEAMRLDDDIVIDYRVTETQEVGLSRGRQADSTPKRLAKAARNAPEVLGKLGDFRQIQALATDPVIRRTLGPVSLLRALA